VYPISWKLRVICNQSDEKSKKQIAIHANIPAKDEEKENYSKGEASLIVKVFYFLCDLIENSLL